MRRVRVATWKRIWTSAVAGLGVALALVALLVNLASSALHRPAPATHLAAAAPTVAQLLSADLRLICRTEGRATTDRDPARNGGHAPDDRQSSCPICAALARAILVAPGGILAYRTALVARPQRPPEPAAHAILAAPAPRSRGPPLTA